jgi:hypothetical protein
MLFSVIEVIFLCFRADEVMALWRFWSLRRRILTSSCCTASHGERLIKSRRSFKRIVANWPSDNDKTFVGDAIVVTSLTTAQTGWLENVSAFSALEDELQIHVSVLC